MRAAGDALHQSDFVTRQLSAAGWPVGGGLRYGHARHLLKKLKRREW
jgi:hypothetical protein